MVDSAAEATGDAGSRRTRDRLLYLLKTRGAMPTSALAAALGISVPATRAHLTALGDEVSSETVRQGVGRPARVWRLTDAARRRFPDTHETLTVRLIHSIGKTLGADALDAVIADQQRQQEATYRVRLAGVKTLAGRLRRLAAVRSEEGYMASVERDGDDWLLIENHCPICAAAAACQGFCAGELDLFRALLGPEARVERTEYLLDGDCRCAYRISKIKG